MFDFYPHMKTWENFSEGFRRYRKETFAESGLSYQ